MSARVHLKCRSEFLHTVVPDISVNLKHCICHHFCQLLSVPVVLLCAEHFAIPESMLQTPVLQDLTAVQ